MLVALLKPKSVAGIPGFAEWEQATELSAPSSFSPRIDDKAEESQREKFATRINPIHTERCAR